MRRVILALILTLFIASPAYAGEVAYTACAADSKLLKLKVELDDTKVTPEVKDHIGEVFAAVAHFLPAEQAAGHVGWLLFSNSLSDEDKEAIVKLGGAPEVIGVCKAT